MAAPRRRRRQFPDSSSSPGRTPPAARGGVQHRPVRSRTGRASRRSARLGRARRRSAGNPESARSPGRPVRPGSGRRQYRASAGRRRRGSPPERFPSVEAAWQAAPTCSRRHPPDRRARCAPARRLAMGLAATGRAPAYRGLPPGVRAPAGRSWCLRRQGHCSRCARLVAPDQATRRSGATSLRRGRTAAPALHGRRRCRALSGSGRTSGAALHRPDSMPTEYGAMVRRSNAAPRAGGHRLEGARRAAEHLVVPAADMKHRHVASAASQRRPGRDAVQ